MRGWCFNELQRGVRAGQTFSLYWFTFGCHWFPHSPCKCPLQCPSWQIWWIPRLNLAVCSPHSNPQLHSLQSKPVLSATRGMLGCTHISQHTVPAIRPQGWGGANQSQLGAFHLPVAHLKSASQQGYVMPSLRLPLATLYSPNRGTGPP